MVLRAIRIEPVRADDTPAVRARYGLHGAHFLATSIAVTLRLGRRLDSDTVRIWTLSRTGKSCRRRYGRAGLSEQDKRAHVRALNLRRRHLNQEQKRGLIREQILDCPTWSDRQVASAIGVDKNTVAAVRMTLPKSEDAVNFTTSDDILLDTRGRRQPRKK